MEWRKGHRSAEHQEVQRTAEKINSKMVEVVDKREASELLKDVCEDL